VEAKGDANGALGRMSIRPYRCVIRGCCARPLVCAGTRIPKNYQSFIRDINNLLTPKCSNGIIDTYLALAIGEC
ncbi:MAG TPA: hypothetical protein DIW44_07315, partial [Anaerolineaceae bacterium]|nr:hypothetical protein [Anaerolineaceae bacterium]